MNKIIVTIAIVLIIALISLGIFLVISNSVKLETNTDQQSSLEDISSKSLESIIEECTLLCEEVYFIGPQTSSCKSTCYASENPEGICLNLKSGLSDLGDDCIKKESKKETLIEYMTRLEKAKNGEIEITHIESANLGAPFGIESFSITKDSVSLTIINEDARSYNIEAFLVDGCGANTEEFELESEKTKELIINCENELEGNALTTEITLGYHKGESPEFELISKGVIQGVIEQ